MSEHNAKTLRIIQKHAALCFGCQDAKRDINGVCKFIFDVEYDDRLMVYRCNHRRVEK